MFPPNNRCFGCHETDHMMGECPKMRELIEQGIIFQDAASRKFMFHDGRPIFRNRTESFYDAITRHLTPASSHYISYDSDISPDYLTHQVSFSDEEEDSDSETDSDDDDGPYWKYAQHAKRQLRYPTFATEPISEVYEAERVTRQSKEARQNNSKVPCKPTAAPKGINSFGDTPKSPLKAI